MCEAEDIGGYCGGDEGFGFGAFLVGSGFSRGEGGAGGGRVVEV